MIPIYYRKLPGNITDVMVLANMLKDISYLNIKKLKFVFDRGFYSEKNINSLMERNYKFICGAKLSLKIIKKNLDDIRPNIAKYTNYNDKLNIYATTVTDEWTSKEEKSKNGKNVSKPRKVYIHYYYNPPKAVDEETRFNQKLKEIEESIEKGLVDPKDIPECSRYFKIEETPEHSLIYTPKMDAIDEKTKNLGYFALLTNDSDNPVLALEICRNKDVIEKSFGDLKERLSMRRMSFSSEEGFEGKLFVQFVALSLLSYIKKKMDENGLFKNYTMQSLLDDLDIIEYYHQPGKSPHVSEITSKQRKIFDCMDVPVPT